MIALNHQRPQFSGNVVNAALMIQLAAFASGSRDNAAMNLVARPMSPEEIEDVAAYLSSW